MVYPQSNRYRHQPQLKTVYELGNLNSHSVEVMADGRTACLYPPETENEGRALVNRR